MRHSATFTLFSACMKTLKSSPSSRISAFPAQPFAMTTTMSFVEVSPSILSMLKVFLTSPESAFCKSAGDMPASVVINTSIVAMFGCIMPLPLAMPPMRQTTPPISNSIATSFLTVSVVIMPSAANAPPSALKPSHSGIMPDPIGSRLIF